MLGRIAKQDIHVMLGRGELAHPALLAQIPHQVLHDLATEVHRAGRVFVRADAGAREADHEDRPFDACFGNSRKALAIRGDGQPARQDVLDLSAHRCELFA